MATNAATLREQGFGETQRRDTWWVQPLAMGAAFVAFIIYATFRGLINATFSLGMGLSRMALYARRVRTSCRRFIRRCSRCRVGCRVDWPGDLRDVDAGRVSADMLLRTQGVLPGAVSGIRRRVRWLSSARRITRASAGSGRFRTSTATSYIWRCCWCACTFTM